MDLLLAPKDPAGPPEKTPYLCLENWDGGIFRTYAHRKGMTRVIPHHLRHTPGLPPSDDAYLEGLYPTPANKLQPFIQTWLFFGLFSELLALNEVEPGVRLIDQATAEKEIAALHKEHIVDEGGSLYLTGLPVRDKGPLIRERIHLAPNALQRLTYLRDCLSFTGILLHATTVNIEESVRFSIAALGEVFSTGIMFAALLAQPKIDLGIVGYNWQNGFMKPGSKIQNDMLSNGWCPSEVALIQARFQGLNTMNYLSKLKKVKPYRDHSDCKRAFCKAFQIDKANYKPAHVGRDCSCKNMSIDESEVADILRHSDTYPIIRMERSQSGSNALEIFPEPFQPGAAYVALSHTWADGAGNPDETALPRCRLEHIADLIEKLQSSIEKDLPKKGVPYRLWLDTLCCPIEISHKKIGLERIADVYRNATHVLVLDRSLSVVKSEDADPLELLARTLCMSPWMRRLWTLQEATLARSLYIQLEDHAVSAAKLLESVFLSARLEARVMRVWQDLNNEMVQLQVYGAKDGWAVMGHDNFKFLIQLQRSLHFRSVSVPEDEGLCISTLLKLNTEYIAAVTHPEERMVRVWEELARASGGFSARLIFFVDRTLNVDGWRWAPSSLLASDLDTSILTMDERIMRFGSIGDLQNSATPALGIPTSLGLKVKLPGLLIKPRTRLPHLPLHPWSDLIWPSEAQIVIYNETTGDWFRIIDWYRSRMLGEWTLEEKNAYDRKVNDPLCRSIHTGHCALILESPMVGDRPAHGCMVQTSNLSDAEKQDVALCSDPSHPAFKARRERTVLCSPLSDAERRMMETLRDAANRIANHKTTAELVQFEERTGPAWEDAKAEARNIIKSIVDEAWNSDPSFEQTVKDTIGEDLRDHVWTLLLQLFSHDVLSVPLSEDVVWFVD